MSQKGYSGSRNVCSHSLPLWGGGGGGGRRAGLQSVSNQRINHGAGCFCLDLSRVADHMHEVWALQPHEAFTMWPWTIWSSPLLSALPQESALHVPHNMISLMEEGSWILVVSRPPPRAPGTGGNLSTPQWVHSPFIHRHRLSHSPCIYSTSFTGMPLSISSCTFIPVCSTITTHCHQSLLHNIPKVY